MAEVEYNVETLTLAMSGWRIVGWALLEDRMPDGADLIATTIDGERRFPLSVGYHRPDVARHYPHARHGAVAGFQGFGAQELRQARTIELRLTFAGADPIAIDISRYLKPNVRAVARLLDLGGKALQLVRQGKASEAISRGRDEIAGFAESLAARLATQAERRRIAAKARHCCLVVDHGMGGGANLFSSELVSDLGEAGHGVCVWRYGLSTMTNTLEFTLEGKRQVLSFPTASSATQYLGRLDIAALHVNNLVSFPDVPEMLARLTSLNRGGTVETHFYLHDYHAICPSFTLLDCRGSFCGVPGTAVCATCLGAHNDLFVRGQATTDIVAWRASWQAFLKTCAHVRAFSPSSAALFRRSFPAIAAMVEVEEHELPPRQPAALRPTPSLTIGIVGTITRSKGAQRVAELCSHIEATGSDARVVVIGSIEAVLPKSIAKVTGKYSRGELVRLLAAEGVNAAFFASIWPETFSFVVAELDAAGVPIVAFDLGAPADRLKGSPTARLLPVESGPEDILTALNEVALHPSTAPTTPAAAAARRRICVFTSAASNYLPKAQLLASSVKRFHPEADVIYGLCDASTAGMDYRGGVFDDVIAAEDLGIADFPAWAFGHQIVELATAIKPFLLRTLLERGYEQVYYFDPDIVLFSRLDDLFAATMEAAITLTPHQARPETDQQAVIDNELASLKYGVYNLGYVGVNNTATGRAFADWWCDRLYDWCRDDPGSGLFTDQRWIDLAPALFDGVAIVRDARFNVSTWNLTTRTLSGSREEGYSVDGRPLGFYHFTGFDRGAHRVMAERNSRSNPAVLGLVDWYEDEMRSAAASPLSATQWAYGAYSNGTPISAADRKAYRDRADLRASFPQPFDATGRSLFRALRRAERAVASTSRRRVDA